MRDDKRPLDEEILAVVGAEINPDDLISELCKQYEMTDVIEALQRALERHKIALNSDGMVVAAAQLAEAA